MDRLGSLDHSDRLVKPDRLEPLGPKDLLVLRDNPLPAARSLETLEELEGLEPRDRLDSAE